MDRRGRADVQVAGGAQADKARDRFDRVRQVQPGGGQLTQVEAERTSEPDAEREVEAEVEDARLGIERQDVGPDQHLGVGHEHGQVGRRGRELALEHDLVVAGHDRDGDVALADRLERFERLPHVVR